MDEKIKMLLKKGMGFKLKTQNKVFQYATPTSSNFKLVTPDIIFIFNKIITDPQSEKFYVIEFLKINLEPAYLVTAKIIDGRQFDNFTISREDLIENFHFVGNFKEINGKFVCDLLNN